MSLDLYTRQCSLGITAKQLSVAAATVANLGLNPVTKKQVFDAELSPKITSMISTVGFYEHTGDWLYTSGIPAKTGVGGGVMGVLPGQFGISAFAPPIDLSLIHICTRDHHIGNGYFMNDYIMGMEVENK